MINYIIQVVLFQTLFLAVYDLFLQKETFFKWNRAYLLLTPVLAFIIPILKFKSVQQSIPQEYLVQLPEVVLNPEEVIIQATNNTSTMSYLEILFYIGVVLFASTFSIRITKILKLISSNEIVTKDFYKLVILRSKQTAFSFFNYIFINKRLMKEEKLEIINHEIIHCKHKHSLDLLFFEILKILMWFNPMVYIYQNRITVLHEYISDAEIVKETDKKSYFNKLLSITFNVENISFINQFYKQSLIKKRIAMVTKSKSQKMKQLKYLLVIPLLLGMLILSSFEKETITLENNLTIETAKSFNDEFLPLGKKINSTKKEIQKIALKNIDSIVPSGAPSVIVEEVPLFPVAVGVKYSLPISFKIGDKMTSEKQVPINKYNQKQKSPEKYSKGEEVPLFPVAVDVKYSLPISLKIGDKMTSEKQVPINKYNQKQKSPQKYSKGEDVPFAIIEEAPVFPGCEGTKEELKKCLVESIMKHVNTNFNVDLAKNLGLTAGVKRISVMFKIDKKGNVTNVKARAPHKALQEEAIRVVKSIPQMKPGKQRGKAVGVKYSLPIVFKVK